jgi:hypothetical protein
MKKLEYYWPKLSWRLIIGSLFVSSFFFVINTATTSALVLPQANNPQATAVGLSGTVTSPPPSVAATIGTPTNGQVFTTLPITVQGICQSGLLIKLYINNVFVGAADCVNNSYSITTALFNGTNILIVKDFDSLGQEGPDSSSITVQFNNPNVGSGVGVTLTSTFAKLGVSPGTTLQWPVAISGGSPPYAVNIVWGDGKPADLMSEANATNFNINHIYDTAGVYTILAKATDTQGNVAYLQLVGVANGVVGQGSSNNKLNSPTAASNKGIKLNNSTIYVIFGIMFVAFVLAFWLGSRHKLDTIKKKLERGEGL